VFDDPITGYIEDSISLEMQPLVKDKTENEHVQKCAHSEEDGEGLESGYLSSDLQPMLSCNPEKEEEDAQEIVVQGHFPLPETNLDIQQSF
jgi:hypothetical protein